MHNFWEPIMSNVLSDLILINQGNADLSIWPLVAAATLAATMILRRRRSD